MSYQYGNSIYGYPAGYTANIQYEDVFTNNLTAEQISVGEYNVTPHYTLPTNSPTNGQYIGVSGGSVSWVNTFNGFQAQYTGGAISIAAGNSSQNICNTLLIGSNYNTGTFTYTVPVTGIYELNYNVCWIWTSTTNPASGRLDSAFIVVNGGTTFPGYKITQTYAATGISQTFRGINSANYYAQLNSGATIRLTLANNSSANNMVIDSAQLSAKLLQIS
ncbi:MAG: hypothetical protein K0S67_5 [Nitrososphaeraceae archaeon]|jgi:hypothetical protein|nr:hypothetical protein [Nitrososphaeraceae archaeon]